MALLDILLADIPPHTFCRYTSNVGPRLGLLHLSTILLVAE